MTTVRDHETGLRVQTCECDKCHYCDSHLASRHEHDHFPVPQALGGTDVVPTCINCHELKDRMSFENWPAMLATEGLLELLRSAPPWVELMPATPRGLLLALGDYREHWARWSVAGRLVYATCTTISTRSDPPPSPTVLAKLEAVKAKCAKGNAKAVRIAAARELRAAGYSIDAARVIARVTQPDIILCTTPATTPSTP